MAYLQSPPVYQRETINGRRCVRVTYTETEARDTSEARIPGDMIPRFGTIKVVKATLTAGTGSTIRPRFGRASGWTASTQDDIGQVAASAAPHVSDVVGMPYVLGAQKDLYIRSTPNHAAADHTVRTEITILEGHQ